MKNRLVKMTFGRKVVAYVVATILLLAIILGNPFVFAAVSAVNLPSNGIPVAGGNQVIVSNLNVPSRVAFGSYFDVSSVANTDLLLLAPSGNVVINTADGDSIPSGGVQATEVGHYNLSYFGADATFYRDFSIRSYIEDELYLEIEHNGADIPEYAPTGTTIILPMATVTMYDDYGTRSSVLGNADGSQFQEIVSSTSSVVDRVKVEVTGASGRVVLDSTGDGRLQFVALSSVNTSYFVRYSFVSIDPNMTTPLLTQEFRIRTQVGFERDARDIPTVSITAPAREVNLNEQVTLPTATVTDQFQTNARVDIHVQSPNSAGPVKVATVDRDTGWATEVADNAPEVYFDNDRNMSFYPTVEGDYVVTYRAFVPAFADGRVENASQQHRFVIRAIDRLAPIVQEMDDYRIPSAWGSNVYKRADSVNNNNPDLSTPLTREEAVLYFPGFEQLGNSNYDGDSIRVADNVSVTGADGNIPSSNRRLRVEVRLDNPHGNAIWRFNDIAGEPTGTNQGEAPVAGIGVYQPDATFYEGFSFLDYENHLASGNTGATFEGVYTLTYRLIDGAGQVSTRVYSIDITSSFEDTTRPIVVMSSNIDRYIVANDELDWSIPNPDVSSANDLRPQRIYTLTDAANQDFEIKFEDSNGIRVVASRLVYIDGKVYLTEYNTDQQTEDLGREISLGNGSIATLTLSLSAVNSVGNESVVDSNVAIPEQVVGPVLTEIIVVTPSFNPTLSAIDTNNINLNQSIVQGSEVNLGGATIASGLNADQIEFVGFEITVRAPSNFEGDTLNNPGVVVPGGIVNNVSIDSWVQSGSLMVDNIRFIPSTSGIYSITIRSFHVNDRHSVWTGYFDVLARGSTGGPNSGRSTTFSTRNTVTVPQITQTFESYRLPSWTELEPNDGPDAHMRRRITGGAYELMGDLFTPKTVGLYQFDTQWFDDYTQSWEDGQALGGGSFISRANDTEEGVIKIVGDRPMATYLERSSTNRYLLPQVVASNSHVNFEVLRPVVSSRTGNVVVTHTRDLNNWDDAQGQGWTFMPSLDGAYTVTYTATSGSLNVTRTYTIYVGRIESPAIALQEGTADTTIDQRRLSNSTFARAYGYTFYFQIIRVNDLSNDSYTNQNNQEINERGYTFSKVLIDPSGNQVTTITDRWSEGSGVTLNQSGNWTVKYTITDNVGNTSVINDTIIVSSQSNSSVFSLATISTILIVVGIVLVVGAFVYLLLFRRVRIQPTDTK